MTTTYNTITEANTFIRVYNSIPTGKGMWARLVSSAPGVYVVEVA